MSESETGSDMDPRVKPEGNDFLVGGRASG